MTRKDIWSILCLLFLSIGAAAQSLYMQAGTGRAQKQEVVDRVLYRITYKTKVVNDTTRRDSLGRYRYRDDDMRLDIGTQISIFYSGRKAAYSSAMTEQLLHDHAIDLRKIAVSKPNVSWIVYRNYPKGQTSYLDEANLNNYRISEKTVTPVWTLDADTCTILGYHCTKAEADFKGRHWTVWFAEDVPLDNGPWKLCGLPGLILKAEDAQQQYIFEAVGLEQLDGKEDLLLIKGYKKYEAVSQQQFDKINRTTTKADTMFRNGNLVVKTTDRDGHELTEAETRQIYGKPLPCNPIEIAK